MTTIPPELQSDYLRVLVGDMDSVEFYQKALEMEADLVNRFHLLVDLASAYSGRRQLALATATTDQAEALLPELEAMPDLPDYETPGGVAVFYPVWQIWKIIPSLLGWMPVPEPEPLPPPMEQYRNAVQRERERIAWLQTKKRAGYN